MHRHYEEDEYCSMGLGTAANTRYLIHDIGEFLISANFEYCGGLTSSANGY